jgi:hypothetical protein
MKWRLDVFDNIEITFHPNATVCDRVIVEVLCAEYAQNAVVKPSELTDKVMLK